MKKEVMALIYTIIANGVVSIIKISSGLIGGSNALISDGLHTICDLITDVFALIGMKISKKRPNKNHPFGYGKVEYLTNIFIGVLILLLGTYIGISSFFKESIKPDGMLIYGIIIVIIIKTISTIYLSIAGKKLKSNLLLSARKVSLSDIYSTILVLIIIFLSQFEDKIPFVKYLDLLGSIVIGLAVLKMALNIIRNNVLSLIGETLIDEKLYSEIKEDIKEIKKINLKGLNLYKYGPYYRANVRIELNSNMRIKEYMYIEKEINKKLKKKRYNIKYVSIDIEE
ncbi:MAG: cation transporter [Bacilli bacterium]|nr:cation transporter [Bacilli bacterium]